MLGFAKNNTFLYCNSLRLAILLLRIFEHFLGEGSDICAIWFGYFTPLE
jgi:hypothetical protein